MRAIRYASIILPLAGLGAFLALSQGCFNPTYGNPGFYCHSEDNPACPDGQTCVGGRCIGGSSSGGDGGQPGDSIVPKTGTYTGAKLDPGLDDVSKCTDSPLEPNDTIDNAVPGLTMSLNLQPDAASPKLQNLAICPTGKNPKAKGHDVDYYEIEATQSVSALVEITYDVKYGDLDVGIFRADGSLVAGDGSSVSNGCVAASLPAGKYYVGVGGANNADSNRYDLHIRFFSSPRSCSGAGVPDMSL